MPVATFGAVRGIGVGELAGGRCGDPALEHLSPARTPGRRDREGPRRPAWLHRLARAPGSPTAAASRSRRSPTARSSTKQGVTFHSSLDGRRRRLTPESAIAIQEALGSDIAMVLDECLPVAARGDERTDARALEGALERTLRWAARSQAARRRPDQAVFAIVQGGADERLRLRSAEATAALDFDGYAHGGLGLGETREERRASIRAAHAALPAERPRYLMGLGRPLDLLDGIAEGVDLFDCVVPTRNGRHGLVYTSRGTLHLRNASFERDASPIDPDCACPACRPAFARLSPPPASQRREPRFAPRLPAQPHVLLEVDGASPRGDCSGSLRVAPRRDRSAGPAERRPWTPPTSLTSLPSMTAPATANAACSGSASPSIAGHDREALGLLGPQPRSDAFAQGLESRASSPAATAIVPSTIRSGSKAITSGHDAERRGDRASAIARPARRNHLREPPRAGSRERCASDLRRRARRSGSIRARCAEAASTRPAPRYRPRGNRAAHSGSGAPFRTMGI